MLADLDQPFQDGITGPLHYAMEGSVKSHAQLAAGYLSSAVEEAMSRAKPDVLMQGLRYMSTVSQKMILQGESAAITTTSDRISSISMAGVARKDYMPVTNCGVEQLAALSLGLIRSASNGDHHFAIREVREDVFSIAMLLVRQMQNSTLMSVHSTTLGPYFSLTSVNSFPAALTDLANELLNVADENTNAQQVISNLEDWADQLYIPYKNLLLAAVAQRSHLTFDLLHWGSHIVKVLLCVSCSPACTEHARGELQREADWLIAQLSWIPDDEKTISYVETFQPADMLFELALEAHRRDAPDVVDGVFKLLVDWAFKAGKYSNGWGSLEEALCCATVLCAMDVVPPLVLMTDIDARLTKTDAPEQGIRERAARELRKKAHSRNQHQYAVRHVRHALARLDPELRRSLFEEVASKLLGGRI